MIILVKGLLRILGIFYNNNKNIKKEKENKQLIKL